MGYAPSIGFGQPQMTGYGSSAGPPAMNMFQQSQRPIVVRRASKDLLVSRDIRLNLSGRTAGDPRIGGRLCPTCYGEGVTVGGFLLLDTTTCYR